MNHDGFNHEEHEGTIEQLGNVVHARCVTGDLTGGHLRSVKSSPLSLIFVIFVIFVLNLIFVVRDFRDLRGCNL